MIAALLPASVVGAELIGVDGPVDRLFDIEAEAVRNAVHGRRHEFALGRTCARRALAALGVGPVAIPVGLRRQPVWPAGFTGSITHCRGYCAAAVTRAGEAGSVGIDAEPDEPLPDGVCDLVLRPEERRVASELGAGPAWDRLLFSIKEAVYKAWSTEADPWLDFPDVRVALDPASSAFEAEVTRRGIVTGRFTSHNGIVLCAAVRNLPG
jgi:4'-phosphopantetheinyl transferase EntD